MRERHRERSTSSPSSPPSSALVRSSSAKLQLHGTLALHTHSLLRVASISSRSPRTRKWQRSALGWKKSNHFGLIVALVCDDVHSQTLDLPKFATIKR